MEHSIDVKVYYEDTDCLGIVYYANYLKFMERGRTEFINATGRNIADLNRDGYNFAVYEVRVKFIKAARLGDVLKVTTSTSEKPSDYRRKLIQKIELDGTKIIEAEVDIICLDGNQKLRVFPEGLMD